MILTAAFLMGSLTFLSCSSDDDPVFERTQPVVTAEEDGDEALEAEERRDAPQWMEDNGYVWDESIYNRGQMFIITSIPQANVPLDISKGGEYEVETSEPTFYHAVLIHVDEKNISDNEGGDYLPTPVREEMEYPCVYMKDYKDIVTVIQLDEFHYRVRVNPVEAYHLRLVFGFIPWDYEHFKFNTFVVGAYPGGVFPK